MQILFSDNTQIPIKLNNSPVQDTLLSTYKHLQHVPLNFLGPDYPGRFIDATLEDIVDRVIEYAQKLSIEVDRDRCLSRSQEYFNDLHVIYEKNYNGDPAWLMYHEYIHLCEYFILGVLENRMDINYREKSGLLVKPFNMDWMKAAKTQVRAGDVFIHWTELGKMPYLYWLHNEPNDIQRMCELAKPWRTFQSKLSVALSDRDYLEDKRIDEFNAWWENYSEEWCKHWNIPKWTLEDQYSIIVVGRIEPIEPLVKLLKNQIYPIKVQL